MQIVVIDYDAGNTRSVQRALQAIATEGDTVTISREPALIQHAEAVVLPGQGAAGQCMSNLQRTGMAELVLERVAQGKPFMGVCVGLQLMFSYLEENDTTGLGILPGEVVRFPSRPEFKVPQIGWNSVEQVQASPLWENVPDNSYFYFVHSYYPHPTANNTVAGVTNYGFDFACAFSTERWYATQFHPEKSGKPGLQLYANFLKMARQYN